MTVDIYIRPRILAEKKKERSNERMEEWKNERRKGGKKMGRKKGGREERRKEGRRTREEKVKSNTDLVQKECEGKKK